MSDSIAPELYMRVGADADASHPHPRRIILGNGIIEFQFLDVSEKEFLVPSWVEALDKPRELGISVAKSFHLVHSVMLEVGLDIETISNEEVFQLVDDTKLSEETDIDAHEVNDRVLEMVRHNLRLEPFQRRFCIAEMMDRWAFKYHTLGTPIWLAAKAQYSLVRGDLFEFGCYSTLLEMKLKHERDALRGKKTNSAASTGGKMRGAELAADTQDRLMEMKRLVDQGKSVTDAARFAHKNGFGTSAAANRQLWYSHNKSHATE